MTGCRDCEMSKTSLAEIEAMVKRLLVAHEEAESIAAQIRMKTVMGAFPSGVGDHAAEHVALAKAAKAQDRMARAVIAAGITGQSECTWVLANNVPTTVTLAELKEAMALSLQAKGAVWVAPYIG